MPISEYMNGFTLKTVWLLHREWAVILSMS